MFDVLDTFIIKYEEYLNFIGNFRFDDLLTYINGEGQRTHFKGMLNLMSYANYSTTDYWRIAKDHEGYYTGNLVTPVELFVQIATGLLSCE